MIDSELGTFLEGGVGIHIGTRNAHLQPNGARAAAIKVDDDGVHLVVYIAEAAARRVLPDLRSTGQAAVVFARPTDDRACQVKGAFIGVRAAAENERQFVEAQWDRFLAQLEKIGIPRAAAQGWITWPAVAVRLRATAVFEQTPGPDAGAPLSSRP
jgi:hypothetical protein